MSLIYNKDFNFSGTSQVEVTEGTEPVTIATMSATFQNDGRLYFSKNIDDVALYAANKATVDKDFSDFEGKVLESVGDVTKTVEK